MDDDQRERSVRNMQSLLRFCVGETSGTETTAAESQENVMSQERRSFLEGAFAGIQNVVEEMRKRICVVREYLQSGNNAQEALTALDDLLEFVSEIDNASDFHKIGGFDIFSPAISSSNSALQIRSCDLLAEIVQNNEYCQNAAIEYNLLELLVKTVDKDPDEEVKVKALYALSCLIRGNDAIQSQFESKCDGLSVLLRALQTNTESNKLRIKASFILTALCQEQPKFRHTLLNMGFVEQIVALLHEPHDKSHEFLLAALYALVSEHKESLTECRRSQLKLEMLLRQRIQLLNEKDEFREESEYCQQMLRLCFDNEEDSNVTDR